MKEGFLGTPELGKFIGAEVLYYIEAETNCFDRIKQLRYTSH